MALLTLLDLSAAFDSVDHATLIQRLQKSCGLGEVALKWIDHIIPQWAKTVVRMTVTTSKPSAVLFGVHTPRFGPRTYPFRALLCRCTAACERP